MSFEGPWGGGSGSQDFYYYYTVCTGGPVAFIFYRENTGKLSLTLKKSGFARLGEEEGAHGRRRRRRRRVCVT